MTQPNQTTLQCSNCGTPNPVQLRRVVDVQREPQAKTALLSGRLNAFTCQNCGQQNQVSTPLLYHDAEKELLIALVPMDVAMRQPGQNDEQIIGSLMNELTQMLPKDSFRSYMFNPKRALTMQGLIEQVMEADGVTPEMLAQQRERVNLLQKLLEADSEDALIQLIQQNDEAIDGSFFQTLALMAQRAYDEGQQAVAGGLVNVQQFLLQHSTYGQEVAQRQQQQEAMVQLVMEDVNNLGDQPTRDDFLDLVLQYRDDEQKLQALVGLARPAMDYEFFTQFGERISQAAANERDELEKLRDDVRSLTEAVDQQSRSVMQQKAQFLQALLNSADYEGMLRENIEFIDENFLAVLTANVQEADRRGDAAVSGKLREIYEKAMELLRAQMPPQIRFVNELLAAPDEQSQQAVIQAHPDQLTPEILLVVDDAVDVFNQQGQTEVVQRLKDIRVVLENALA